MPIQFRRVTTPLHCEFITMFIFSNSSTSLNIQPLVERVFFRFNDLRVFNRLTLGFALLLGKRKKHLTKRIAKGHYLSRRV